MREEFLFEPKQRVIFRAFMAAQPEHGVVVRWNNSRSLVFVLFDGDTAPKAVDPGRLT